MLIAMLIGAGIFGGVGLTAVSIAAGERGPSLADVGIIVGCVIIGVSAGAMVHVLS
mgnify:CR=1 FL=1